jgi:glycogen debranching enzyme
MRTLERCCPKEYKRAIADVTGQEINFRLPLIVDSFKRKYPFVDPAVFIDGSTSEEDYLPADPHLFDEDLHAYWTALIALPPAEHTPFAGTARTIDTAQLQTIFERVSNQHNSTFVLKNGGLFLSVDDAGKFRLFKDDTVYLTWTYQIDGRPLCVKEERGNRGYSGVFSLTDAGEPVAVSVDAVIVDNRLVQRITVRNTQVSGKPVRVTLQQNLDAPFEDIFELRGAKRLLRGTDAPVRIDKDRRQGIFSYTGCDGRTMSDVVQLDASGPPIETPQQLNLPANLGPLQEISFTETVLPQISESQERIPPDATKRNGDITMSLAAAAQLSDDTYQKWLAAETTFQSNDPTFDRIIERAQRDLYMLRQPTPGGMAIAAGLPWFATAFGRDDAITAMQTLPFIPSFSSMILKTLAYYQGTKFDPTDAERSGKFIHELRLCEMARHNETPFAHYYGSVDSTPLWVMLLGRYVRQTDDVSLARDLESNLSRALDYLDNEVKRGNGYLTYGGDKSEALSNQCWKDSGNSIMYADGELASPPIAVCEVQGYLYDAWLQAAFIERRLGNGKRADELGAKAADLKQRFATDFWMKDKDFPALALDGNKRQANVIASNAGQLLMTGILTDEQARCVVARLMKPDMFSGFGIRTLSSNEKCYFANSYHDGSVWPHDNSLIVAGMHEYDPQAACKVMSGLIDAATHQPDDRLPELFGGWSKEDVGVPIPYPVSCKPQAWAAGSLFMMLAANLGLHVDGSAKSIRITNPELPDGLTTLTVRGIAVGNQTVDLEFKLVAGKVHVQVLRKPGSIKVLV